MVFKRTVTNTYNIVARADKPIFVFKDFMNARKKYGMKTAEFERCFMCKKAFEDEEGVYFATVTPGIGNRFLCGACAEKVVADV
jgi:hypothetical protein